MIQATGVNDISVYAHIASRRLYAAS